MGGPSKGFPPSRHRVVFLLPRHDNSGATFLPAPQNRTNRANQSAGTALAMKIVALLGSCGPVFGPIICIHWEIRATERCLFFGALCVSLLIPVRFALYLK